MKNLIFIIWMLGFPLIISLCNLIELPIKKRFDNEYGAGAAFLEFIVWLIIGVILYE